MVADGHTLFAHVLDILARILFLISGGTAIFVICYDVHRAWGRIGAALRGVPYKEDEDVHPWK